MSDIKPYSQTTCKSCGAEACFVYNSDTYFCMACGASGSIKPPDPPAITKEAAAMLAFNAAADRIFRNTLTSQAGYEARKYLANRKMTDETVKSWGLGYVPQYLEKELRKQGYDDDIMLGSGLFKKDDNGRLWSALSHRITFPIIDQYGNVLGFGGRVMDQTEPKYKNSPETPVYSKRKHLYGWNKAVWSKENFVILCEGYMDVIALHQAGLTNAVASLGTALTKEQVQLLKTKVRKAVLLYDTDVAGRKATDRGISMLRQEGLQILVANTLPCKDPDEYIRKYGITAFHQKLKAAQTDLEYRLENARKEDGSLDYEAMLDVALEGYSVKSVKKALNRINA